MKTRLCEVRLDLMDETFPNICANCLPSMLTLFLEKDVDKVRVSIQFSVLASLHNYLYIVGGSADHQSGVSIERAKTRSIEMTGLFWSQGTAASLSSMSSAQQLTFDCWTGNLFFFSPNSCPKRLSSHSSTTGLHYPQGQDWGSQSRREYTENAVE